MTYDPRGTCRGQERSPIATKSVPEFMNVLNPRKYYSLMQPSHVECMQNVRKAVAMILSLTHKYRRVHQIWIAIPTHSTA